MKKRINSILVFVLVFLIVSCENNFDEINTNTVDPTSDSVDPVYLLNNAIIYCSSQQVQIIFDLGTVQQVVSPNSGTLSGGNFNQENPEESQVYWNVFYEGVIKNTADIITQLEEEDALERPNLLNMAKLIQSYAFMVLTDEYGDVPYSEAGKGISEQIVLPKYDAQETIYKDLINVVSAATASLSNSATPEPGEVLYSGDIDQWKRMGNSLLLRLGMRLTEVDLALAEQTVQTAFAGGVMQNRDDSFIVRHDNNYYNDVGDVLNGSEANNYYLVDSFVDYLSSTNDPRLSALSIRFVGASSGPEQVRELGSKLAEDQIGMPMGNDNLSIGQVASDLGLVSFYDFSQIDRFLVAKQSAPNFIITYSQTQLLLAEAAVRGWVSGDAAVYFETGVRAHMESMVLYDPALEIPTAEIDDYFVANPFDVSNALEQINTQYWVSCFLNGPEAFANFRRSGFPTLTPNPYSSQDISSDFINRLNYPTSEVATNNKNLSEAVSRMGPDKMDTKVWWDQ